MFDASPILDRLSALARRLGPPSVKPEPLSLPDGDKQPFQQMTFTLHDSQADIVRRALDAAKDAGDFDGSPNENSNGNALARIAEAFLG